VRFLEDNCLPIIAFLVLLVGYLFHRSQKKAMEAYRIGNQLDQQRQ
jgi:hypothetical protein